MSKYTAQGNCSFGIPWYGFITWNHDGREDKAHRSPVGCAPSIDECVPTSVWQHWVCAYTALCGCNCGEGAQISIF